MRSSKTIRRFWQARFSPGKPKQISGDGAALRVSPDVKASVHPDGIVLIHLSSGVVFSANRVGAMIWNAVAQRENVHALAASISHNFAVDAQTAERDVASFMAQLEAERLLISDRGSSL